MFVGKKKFNNKNNKITIQTRMKLKMKRYKMNMIIKRKNLVIFQEMIRKEKLNFHISKKQKNLLSMKK